LGLAFFGLTALLFIVQDGLPLLFLLYHDELMNKITIEIFR